MLLTVSDRQAYCYTGGKAFDPALPTIVFVHGAQHDHSVWGLQTRYFAHHGFGVLAVDLPGHGRSAGPALTSVEAMADWLLALLDAAGVRQCALVGHSMGSLIALETAFRAPERAERLALLGTAFPMRVSEMLLEAARNDEPRAIDMVTIWSHSSIAQKPSFPAPGFYTPGGTLRLQQRMSKINPELLFHTDFTACDSYRNGEQAARSLRCPALFMLGKRDMMTPPKAAAALIAAMPQGKVVEIAGSGHFMMGEQPDAVLDHLVSFMRR